MVLESLGCHPKKFGLSFIGEPLKSSDQQRNDIDCCALNWQNEEGQPEKGKIKRQENC